MPDLMYWKLAIWKACSGSVMVVFGAAPSTILNWSSMTGAGQTVAVFGIIVAVIKQLDAFFDTTVSRLAAGKQPIALPGDPPHDAGAAGGGPVRTGLTLLLWLLIFSFPVLWLSGCAFVTKDPAAIPSAQRIGRHVELAAYNATVLVLENNPNLSDKFRSGLMELDLVLASDTLTPPALSRAVKGLPWQEVKSTAGRLIIGNARILYETELRQLVDIDQRHYIKAVAEALRSGINRGLEDTVQ